MIQVMSALRLSPYNFRMSNSGPDLIAAFHEDHKTLGRDLHTLCLCLRSRDLEQARLVAERIDSAAGAHIAFEEEAFYPLLKETLGAGEVERLYREHDRGYAVVRRLRDAAATDRFTEKDWNGLVADTEAMETHIAECGDLFAAMGALSERRQQALCDQLIDWRRRQPKWRDLRRYLLPDTAPASNGGRDEG